MTAIYVLRVYDSAGNWQTDLGPTRAARGLVSLSYSLTRNAPGMLTFELAGDHPLCTQLTRDWLLEVRKRDPDAGIDWTTEGWYTFSKRQHRTETLPGTYTGTAQGILSLLSRRCNAYDAGTVDQASFSNVSVEYLMRALVANNFTGAAATANGRDENGFYTNQALKISVEASQNRGYVFDSRGNSRKEILSELEDLAEITKADFDLIWQNPGWLFRVYPTGMGTDRRADIVFSIERGNMANADMTDDWTDSADVAIVGGQGTEDQRNVQVVTGDPVAAMPIEIFVPYTNENSDAALQSEGKSALQEHRVQREFTFDPLQIRGCTYGVDYFLGDIVSSYYLDETRYHRVKGVSVQLTAKDGERVQVELEDYP